MSGASIDQMIDNEKRTDYTEFEQSIPEQQPKTKGIDLEFFKAETGEGEIVDYINHPLNFNNSNGMSRVLRGLTGMFGSLNLAIIDVIVGALDLMKSNKKVPAHDIPR